MSALIRSRLVNLSKPFHANPTTRPRLNPTLKSLSTKTSKEDIEFQRIFDEFMKSSEDQRFRNRTRYYFAQVKRLAKAKKFDMIEDIIEHQKNFPDIRNEGFAGRLINMYGNAGMFDHARKLFDELPHLGCPRTVNSLNALFKSAITANELRKLVEAFDELPSSLSIKPDVYSHNSLLHALCELGSIDEALSKLREMGEKANLATYNTVSNALYKSRRISEAESLWAAMEGRGIRPDARSFNIRLRAMFSERNVDEAVRLVLEMTMSGIELDMFTYNTLIIGFYGNGNLKEALRWYDELVKSKLLPHLGSTYSTLIPACVEAGYSDRVFELCANAAKQQVSMDLELWRQAIDELCRAGRTEKACVLERLLREHERSGLMIVR